MAFIRNKNVKGKRYNYLVETKREGGKVKSKTIVCLRQSISIDGRIASLEVDLGFVRSCFDSPKLRNACVDSKTMADYQNKINRLSAQIEYLEQLKVEYPTVTVSDTIRQQYEDHLPREQAQQAFLLRSS